MAKEDITKENITKLDYKTKIIQFITTIIALTGAIGAGLITGIISIWCFVVITLTITSAVILGIFVIVKKLYLHRGVFAVSAIVVNENNELLLIYDEKEKKYKQPGCHYKTLAFKNELNLPYSRIWDSICEETGIPDKLLKPIDLSKYGYKDNRPLSLEEILEEEEKEKFVGYTDNTIAPPPFFVMEEKSRPKPKGLLGLFGADFYIDMFYAFKTEISEVEQKKLFRNQAKFYAENTIKELIEEKKVYPDLKFVFENFKRIYQVTNFPNSNIRLCTFNTSENSKKVLLWRITQNCNARCKYCLLLPEASITTFENKPVQISEGAVQNIIDGIKNHEINRMIISGGEPLLVTNLIEIVREIASNTQDTFESITICTNGSNLNNLFKGIVELKEEVGKFKKLVVSVDHYDEKGYFDSKNIDNFRLKTLTDMIKTLRKKGVDVFINVMATEDFFYQTEKYVTFWKTHGFRRLSISFPIKCNNKKKHELKSIYDKIISGGYGDVSFLEKDGLELIIPDCDYAYCDSEKKILYAKTDGIVHEGCIEKPLIVSP